VLEGVFEPSASASSISKAAHFQHRAVPITVRFSNFGGIPDIPDNHPQANPHGLAIKFKLPNGSTTDIVGHSFNGFPTPTTNDFHDLLIALEPAGPKQLSPLRWTHTWRRAPLHKSLPDYQQKSAPVSCRFITLLRRQHIQIH
jgi:catalase